MQTKCKRKEIKKRLIQILFFCIIFSASLIRAESASLPDTVFDGVAVITALDESGNPTDYYNAAVFNYRGINMIITKHYKNLLGESQLVGLNRNSSFGLVDVGYNEDYNCGIYITKDDCIFYQDAGTTRAPEDYVGENVYIVELTSLTDEGISVDCVQMSIEDEENGVLIMSDSLSDEAYNGAAVFTESGEMLGIMNYNNACVSMDYYRTIIDEAFGTGEGEETGTETDSAAVVESNKPLKSPVYLTIISLVLITFFLSLALYNRNNRKRKAGAAEFTFGPSYKKITEPDHPITPISVIGIDGYYKGKVFNLKDGPLIFGRNREKCNVPYPNDTKGVSGLHCRLDLSQQKLVLTDLSSSYGTYLRNGTKLQPNISYELKTGDQFYLAVPEHTFEVR